MSVEYSLGCTVCSMILVRRVVLNTIMYVTLLRNSLNFSYRAPRDWYYLLMEKSSILLFFRDSVNRHRFKYYPSSTLYCTIVHGFKSMFSMVDGKSEPPTHAWMIVSKKAIAFPFQTFGLREAAKKVLFLVAWPLRAPPPSSSLVEKGFFLVLK